MVKEINRVSEIEIRYRTHYKASERPQITTSKQAYKILLEYWNKDKIHLLEECKALLLNRTNKVMGIVDISQGGASGTIIDSKIVFSIALKACAHSIILCHNHPSGNLTPSRSDIELTKKLVACGRMLELPIADHLIISEDGYTSLGDEGYV